MAVPTKTTATFEVFWVGLSQRADDLDGQSEIILRYRVRRLGGSANDVLFDSTDYQLLHEEGVVPKLGQDYGSWYGATPDAPWQQTARCREVNYSHASQNGVVDIECRFTTMYAINYWTFPPDPQINNGQPYTHLPSYVEYSSSLRPMEAYRRFWSTNPPTGTATDITSDIGGLAYKTASKGMIIEVPQTRVRLRFILDCSNTSNPALPKMIDQYNTIEDYFGYINSATFMNFPAGSLLCEGANMVHLQNEYYELVIDFLFDEFYHFSQQADVHPNGQVVYDNNNDPKVVKWVRPTRPNTDFNNIFAGDPIGKAITERGWWDY